MDLNDTTLTTINTADIVVEGHCQNSRTKHLFIYFLILIRKYTKYKAKKEKLKT